MDFISDQSIVNFANKYNNLEILKKEFPDSFLKIGVIGRGSYFIPYREALVEAINKFGFESKGFDSIDYEYSPDVFLIINPFHFKDHTFNTDFIYAGIQTEQIYNEEVYCLDMGLSNYKKLQKCIHKYDLMFEWSPASYRFLKKKYDNIYFLPHCNFKSMQYFKNYHDVEEKYDLIFIGWSTGIYNRRANMLKILSDKYRERQ